MKKLLSLALAAVMLASCGTAPESVTLASSDAAVYADWLTDRIGYTPEGVVLGIGSSAEYGIDMTDFESDGYVLRTVGDTTVAFGKTADGLDRAVREYAKAVATDTVADLDTVYHEGCRIKKLTIAGRDISEYTVYYPADANENMKFAVSELISLVKKACGVELTAVQGEATGNAFEFRFSKDASLGNDGYKYTVTDSGIVFEGAVKRGSMYAVWRFLQNECGWDCLIFGDSYLNPADHVDVPAGTAATETPVLEYLNLYAPAMRFTNDRANPTAAQNSYGTIVQACHGMQNNRFCDEDFWSRQICYTDEGRYEECLANVEAYVKARYGNPGFMDVDIAQGDNHNYCLCDTCMEVFKEEGGHAGAVVRFANKLSEELNEKYPGVVYKIFAYANSNVPPKVTAPNEHIYVTFCYDRNCSNHDLDGSECTTKVGFYNVDNEGFSAWLKGWCELTPNVDVWLYTLDTNLQQYTVIDNIRRDMQFFRDIGARGLFLESETYELGIRRIEHQLWAEMNWDPDMTEAEFEALLCTLLQREYGSGWEHIREFIRHWETSQDLQGCWHCWGWTEIYLFDARYNTGFYRDRFDSFVEMFDAAMAEADSKAQEDAIELLSCTMLYMGCYSSYFREYLEGDTDRIAVLEERYALVLERLRKFGYNPALVPTITSTPSECVSLADTLYEAAWRDWVKKFENITGHPLPEDAPVREP